MKRNNYYDVTDWQVGNPYTDIGEVINSIIADIKNRQKDTNVNDGGKPFRTGDPAGLDDHAGDGNHPDQG